MLVKTISLFKIQMYIIVTVYRSTLWQKMKMWSIEGQEKGKRMSLNYNQLPQSSNCLTLWKFMHGKGVEKK